MGGIFFFKGGGLKGCYGLRDFFAFGGGGGTRFERIGAHFPKKKILGIGENGRFFFSWGKGRF